MRELFRSIAAFLPLMLFAIALAYCQMQPHQHVEFDPYTESPPR